jgi:signal transduction histidine kinase
MLVNAKEAVGEARGGEISLSICSAIVRSGELGPEVTPGAYTRIDLHDNGVGMTPEQQSRCFEPFFTTKGVLKQVAAASKQSTDTQSADSRNAGQGSGLGLFLARSVVTVMNGELTLEPVSAPDLGGARFKIVLPRVVNR